MNASTDQASKTSIVLQLSVDVPASSKRAKVIAKGGLHNNQRLDEFRTSLRQTDRSIARSRALARTETAAAAANDESRLRNYASRFVTAQGVTSVSFSKISVSFDLVSVPRFQEWPSKSRVS